MKAIEVRASARVAVSTDVETLREEPRETLEGDRPEDRAVVPLPGEEGRTLSPGRADVDALYPEWSLG